MKKKNKKVLKPKKEIPNIVDNVTKLKIGPYEWKYIDNCDLKDTFGTCDYKDLEIKISKDQTGLVKKCTIIHELLHAAFCSAGYSPREEEKIVDVLANQLISFVKNNPDFIKKIIESE